MESKTEPGVVVGETGALEKQLVAEEPWLRRVAFRLCRSAHDADDLVQDAFERALRRRHRFDGVNPRGWLGTVMRNLFVDRCRAAARRPATVGVDDAVIADVPTVAPPAWAQITSAELHAAADALPDPFRDAFLLRAIDQLSYRAIAERLGISIDTVASRLRRARLQLRADLSDRAVDVRALERPAA